MRIDFTFFDGDDLLVKGSVECSLPEQSFFFAAKSGVHFIVTSQFEDPACPVSIDCSLNGKKLYRAALRVGVHTSDDWESIDLGEIHTLVFWCHAS